ncbi:RHS repeat-associated core domain-containing protein [Pseudomonas mosselii]|uniref:RHS repeat-associated core domain-containing protein n=1 Tax=Pseudomonas mosselii TaxID=78327 RepID=UPI001BD33F21|nr:RHS repeat-associated core domain-containing protein [Pseudomonas mosselii]MBS9761104.1 RHS repeat-associated core domain-containing protein [Pseudomonas mosselii]
MRPRVTSCRAAACRRGMCGSSIDLHSQGPQSGPGYMGCLIFLPVPLAPHRCQSSDGIHGEGLWTMPTYLFACDKQNTPLGGIGFSDRGFTAYGALTSPISPMTGFCGQPRDARMDRYPLGNGHRRYSPALMRFQEPDTLSPFDKGGINAYMYCAGDPVNRLDPTGGYSALVSQIIQRSGTIALHTASPLALLLGPEPKGGVGGERHTGCPGWFRHQCGGSRVGVGRGGGGNLCCQCRDRSAGSGGRNSDCQGGLGEPSGALAACQGKCQHQCKGSAGPAQRNKYAVDNR